MQQDAQYHLTLTDVSREQAEAAGEALESWLWPEALAVASTEVSEARKIWEVTAYYAQAEEAAEAARRVEADGFPAARISHGALPQTDWVAESLKGLPPVSAGRFFIHGSHDRELRQPNAINLEIDAGTAFGTGHHGTTRGCLIAFDAIAKARKPRRVLDIGCGTGVLGIAAAMATRLKVLASDIDPEAVRVTKLNARLNGAGALITAVTAAGTSHHAIATRAPFDVIFANILARPLVTLAPKLSRLLAPRGSVILSGLTNDQERLVTAAYVNQGLRIGCRVRLNGWSTLTLTRG